MIAWDRLGVLCLQAHPPHGSPVLTLAASKPTCFLWQEALNHFGKEAKHNNPLMLLTSAANLRPMKILGYTQIHMYVSYVTHTTDPNWSPFSSSQMKVVLLFTEHHLCAKQCANYREAQWCKTITFAFKNVVFQVFIFIALKLKTTKLLNWFVHYETLRPQVCFRKLHFLQEHVNANVFISCQCCNK